MGSGCFRAVTDNSLRLWDAATGKVLRCFAGHTNSVFRVTISPNGKRALSGSLDKTVRLWDLESGKELRCFRGHEGGAVCGVAFAPDGKSVLSGGVDNTLRLWNVETGKELRCFKGHVGDVNDVKFSPDGKRALSSSTVTLFIHPAVRAVVGTSLWRRASGRSVPLRCDATLG